MDGIAQNNPEVKPDAAIIRKGFFQTKKGLTVLATAGLIILVCLTTAALNYFRIISLPKQFSFLPKKQVQRPAAKPIPALELSFDTTAQKTILTSLKQTLNPALEANLDKLKLAHDKITRLNFTTTLETKKGLAQLSSNVSPNGQSISSLYFSLLHSGTASPSASFAQANIASVFTIKPKGSWGCKPTQDFQYCENFWEENKVKKGVGVYGPITIKDEKRLTFFFCQFDPKSTGYTWKSCTIEFAKTGIK